MTNYQYYKNRAREFAMAWQRDFAENKYTYVELVNYNCIFKKHARNYGLTKEFKREGII